MYQKLKKTKTKQARLFDFLCAQIIGEETYRLKEYPLDFLCHECISHAERTVDYYCTALKLLLDTLIGKNQNVDIIFPLYHFIAQKCKVRIIFNDNNKRVVVDCQSFKEVLDELYRQEVLDL